MTNTLPNKTESHRHNSNQYQRSPLGSTHPSKHHQTHAEKRPLPTSHSTERLHNGLHAHTHEDTYAAISLRSGFVPLAATQSSRFQRSTHRHSRNSHTYTHIDCYSRFSGVLPMLSCVSLSLTLSVMLWRGASLEDSSPTALLCLLLVAGSIMVGAAVRWALLD